MVLSGCIWKSYRLLLSCLLLVLFFLPGSSFAALRSVDSLSPEHPVYRKIQEVYDNLVRSFGDGRTPPRLVVPPVGVATGRAVAWSDPGDTVSFGISRTPSMLQGGYIAIEERVYHLFAPLGKDRDNAVAFLLGHELAHYYLRHGWVGDFGNTFTYLDVGRKVLKVASYEEVVKCEAEADYVGGFYGFLSGYDTFGLASRVLDLVYSAYRLPDKLPNYPSLAERKVIALKAEGNIREIVPVFDAANRLLILEKYEAAARLFEYLAQVFPSREMFNNAGVAYALEALRLPSLEEDRFAYPFEFDPETRLRQAAALRKTRGAWISTSSLRNRERLLKAAKELFTRAFRRDEGYTVALVNLAAAESLLGEREAALLCVEQALRLAKRTGDSYGEAGALVVRGILRAEEKRVNHARADFSSALALKNPVAELNIKALSGKSSPVVALPDRYTAGASEETIGGVRVGDVAGKAVTAVTFILNGLEKGQEPITVRSFRKNGLDVVQVSVQGKFIRILGASDEYEGQSLRGIRIGSRGDDVRKVYGEPSRVVPVRRGSCLHYCTPKVNFCLNGEGRVESWFLYTME